jgi:hypothetical protein
MQQDAGRVSRLWLRLRLLVRPNHSCLITLLLDADDGLIIFQVLSPVKPAPGSQSLDVWVKSRRVNEWRCFPVRL